MWSFYKSKKFLRSAFSLLSVNGDNEVVTDAEGDVEWFQPESSKKNLVSSCMILSCRFLIVTVASVIIFLKYSTVIGKEHDQKCFTSMKYSTVIETVPCYFRNTFLLLLVDGDEEVVTDVEGDADWFQPESGENLP